MECPVCNNPELPDYLSEPTYCPSCKSDLKGFMLINRVEKESGTKLNRLKLFSSSIAIALVICMLGSVFYFSEFAGNKPEKTIIQNDSTAFYKNLVAELRQKLDKKPESVEVFYIIKKDDNLSGIAKLFFNDGSFVKQIMTDNNLQKGYNLLPGDTLVIKFKNNRVYTKSLPILIKKPHQFYQRKNEYCNRRFKRASYFKPYHNQRVTCSDKKT